MSQRPNHIYFKQEGENLSLGQSETSNEGRSAINMSLGQSESLDNEWSKVNNKQTKKRQNKNSHEWSDSGSWRATRNQPVPLAPEAVIRSPQAVVRSSEAVIRSPQAVVRSSEAVIRSPEAVIRSPEAVIRSSEAVIRSPQVVVRSSEAVIHSSQAVVRSSEAVIRSSEAVICSPEAVVQSNPVISVRLRPIPGDAWSRNIWEKIFGPMEETKRRDTAWAKKEREKNIKFADDYAHKLNPGLEKARRALIKKRQDESAAPTSHQALQISRLGEKHGHEKEGAFLVPETLEWDSNRLVFGFLANKNQAFVNGSLHSLRLITLNRRGKLSAGSEYKQSMRYALGRSKGKGKGNAKQIRTNNVKLSEIADGLAILVALRLEVEGTGICDGVEEIQVIDSNKQITTVTRAVKQSIHDSARDVYKLVTIYQPIDAITLALAGALDDLLHSSKKNVEFEDIKVAYDEFDFDFKEDEYVRPVVQGSTVPERLAYLLSNKDQLRRHIKNCEGNNEDENYAVEAQTTIEYGSGMPIYIDPYLYAIYKYLKTPKGTTTLEEWIELRSGSKEMSVVEYRDWLFTAAGENMLDLFLEVIEYDLAVLYPAFEDDTTPSLEDDTTPSLEDNATPVLRDNATPVLSDDATPVLRNDATPVLRDDATPILRDDAIPVLRDDATPVLRDNAASVVSTRRLENTQALDDFESSTDFFFSENLLRPISINNSGLVDIPDLMLDRNIKEDTRRTKGKKNEKLAKTNGKVKSSKGSGKENRFRMAVL